jgi:hypothetical protein
MIAMVNGKYSRCSKYSCRHASSLLMWCVVALNNHRPLESAICWRPAALDEAWHAPLHAHVSAKVWQNLQGKQQLNCVSVLTVNLAGIQLGMFATTAVHEPTLSSCCTLSSIGVAIASSVLSDWCACSNLLPRGRQSLLLQLCF